MVTNVEGDMVDDMVIFMPRLPLKKHWRGFAIIGGDALRSNKQWARKGVLDGERFLVL